MSLFKYIYVILAVFCCFRAAHSQSRIKMELKNDVFIQDAHIAENPIFQSRWRYDNNDRNTSAAYDLWDRAGYHLFEWPGNITQMDSSYPLLRWGKERSRFVQSPCEAERGMELATYAHKYLHLTWGANRLTSSYCNPLRVRRKDLPEEERWREEYNVVAVDFNFVFDALLVVTQQGYIIRFGDIEITYRRAVKLSPKVFHGNLTYTVAKGITAPVNKIIVQNCCSKSVGFCTHGETVLAYREASYLSIIFISHNGGRTFKELQLIFPENAKYLHSLIFYPTWKRIFVLHGTPSKMAINGFSTENGLLSKFKNHDKLNITTQGFVQSSRINNEMSFLIWDDCSVWYGNPVSGELILSKAVFYIHKSIRLDIKKVNATTGDNPFPHVIRHSHCYFGRNSALSFGDEGKIGLLDTNNVFFYGVDLKSVDFPLIGLSTDMSLLLPEKKQTICPCFDRNNRPKLLYPPRYLRLPRADMMDKDYSKRLGMRIVKKTLFPSDFMAPFWEENLPNLPSFYKRLAISKCQTSSLSIEGSLTQKVKTYKINIKHPISVIATFISISNASGQLQYEPQDLSAIFNISLDQIATSPTSGDRFWFKHSINITLREEYYDLFSDQEMFYMNFFTLKTLRCVHQPQYPVWVTVDISYKAAYELPLNKVKQEFVLPSKTEGAGTDCSETLYVQHCPHQHQLDRKTTGVCSASVLTSAISQTYNQ